jgi:ATPase subunit of ABC transporter with duplicated ATPase domains
MSIVVCDVSYRYFNCQSLFEHISFSVPANGKVSVVGNNGSGKSTLLRLLAGELRPSSGSVRCLSQPYYIPQQAGFAGQSVSEALGIAEKINALHAIYSGAAGQIHFDRLADDWDIESRCRSALDYWGLKGIDCLSLMDALSGGEKTKVYLAGLLVHKPGIILLDEPTNHLDQTGRQKLYDYIIRSKAAIVAVSHDITLLNQLDTTFELSEKGLRPYGGNYDFYREQKEMEENALAQHTDSAETALRLARKKAQEVKERQEKRVSRSRKDTSGIPRALVDKRQAQGEYTGAKLSKKQEELITGSRQKLLELQKQQRNMFQLKIDVEDARLHNGKILVSALNVNFGYDTGKMLWPTPLNIEIRSGERIHIKGDNGTGKTTLIKLLAGELAPVTGEIRKSDFSYICLDQQYSPVHRDTAVLELAESYNHGNLPEHEIKLRLNRALFPKETWNKNCLALSGGERMRLYLCCLMISNHIPDMFILDEPANNLDLSSLSILTRVIGNYRGTLMVVSHDSRFTDEIGITKRIELKNRLSSKD